MLHTTITKSLKIPQKRCRTLIFFLPYLQTGAKNIKIIINYLGFAAISYYFFLN